MTKFGLQMIRFLLRGRGAKLSISFDSLNVQDGLGAQLQRQISIGALAEFLRINFIPVPLSQIAMHPLDDFKNVKEMNEFLSIVNSFFGFVNHLYRPNGKDVSLRKVSVGRLFYISLMVRLFDVSFHITASEVYGLVDTIPEIYNQFIQTNMNLDEKLIEGLEIIDSDISIHYRQGVGGKAIYPGQKIPRELDADYFISILDSLITENRTITIFTDAPEGDFEFVPTNEQLHLWIGTPGFHNGVVYVKGLNLENYFSSAGHTVKVVSGGSLLEALISMAKSETLIMSRSSLSYVAALLNTSSQIFYPPEFWHPPLARWIKRG